MSLSRALERRASPENPSTPLSNPAAWLYEALGGRRTAAGIAVNENSAMRTATVYACVRVLAETLAMLPLPVYRRIGSGAERDPDHPNFQLLHDRPNPELTSFLFREMLQAHIALWGNAYAEKEIGADGRVKALWPLLPDRTRPKRLENGARVYVTRLANGKDVGIPANRVVHIPGLGFNGVEGFSPIRMAMDAVALGKAAEEFGARFFGSGAQLNGVLTHPGVLGEAGRQNLRESFEMMYSGLGNSHRTAILEEGVEYERIGIPPNEAQFIELRKYQRSEIAAIYRVPPHMVGDLDRPFQSNVEQMDLDFVRHTMAPWFVRWEQVLNWDLFAPIERRTFYAEFLVEGLLRGDSAARAAFYKEMVYIGAYTQNDVLRRENMNTFPEGNERWMPLNMVPLSALVKAAQQDPPAAPGGAAGGEGARRALPPAAVTETRTTSGVVFRWRIQNAHERLFREAAERVVRHEVQAGRKALRKSADPQVGVLRAGMRKWMEEFYPGHSEYVIRQMTPVIEALGEAIWAAAIDEIGAEHELTPEAEQFLRQYAEAQAARWVGSSQGQLDALLDSIDVADGDELSAMLDQRFGEWEETRADKTGKNEKIQLGSAMAKVAWVTAGVTLLRWVANATACGLCQDMDGTIVDIDGSFVTENETIEGEDENQAPLTARRSLAHPPLHGGCSCGIAPEVARGMRGLARHSTTAARLVAAARGTHAEVGGFE